MNPEAINVLDRPLITIGIVSWNSETVLADCLRSVFLLEYSPIEVYVYDNASADKTLGVLADFPEVKIIKSEENIGFGAAHNAILRRTNSPLYLCLNPDTQIEPDALTEMIKTMTKHPKCGQVGGKLKRIQDGKKTNIIDSVGVLLSQNFSARDMGANEPDTGQFGTECERFGISGACVLLRRSALQAISHHLKGRTEYFDELFFAYKEDVDLAYRLRAAGFSAWYTPEAVIYHARAVREAKKGRFAAFSRLTARLFHKAKHINRLSYQNQRLLLLKHLRRHQDPVIQFKTWWYQLQVFVYLFIFETETLLEWGNIIKKWKNIRRKARQMPYTVHPSEISAWME